MSFDFIYVWNYYCLISITYFNSIISFVLPWYLDSNFRVSDQHARAVCGRAVQL